MRHLYLFISYKILWWERNTPEWELTAQIQQVVGENKQCAVEEKVSFFSGSMLRSECLTCFVKGAVCDLRWPASWTADDLSEFGFSNFSHARIVNRHQQARVQNSGSFIPHTVLTYWSALFPGHSVPHDVCWVRPLLTRTHSLIACQVSNNFKTQVVKYQYR